MLRLDLALELTTHCLVWWPQRGDRFVVPDRDMDDEVFVVSDMVVEVHQRPSGQVLGFNGTTEWALDSIETDTVVWLPREQQLRVLLGRQFRALEAQPHGFVVVIERDGAEQQFVDVDAEQAYARALLAVLES